MSVVATTLVDRDVLAGDLARGGYLRGAFAGSGLAVDRWFRTDLVLCRPGVLQRCAELLAAAIDPRADRLAARGAAATALATAVALRTDLSLLLPAPATGGDGDGAPAFTGDLFPAARVVLVEDVVMTGAHSCASIAALDAAGLAPCQVLTVVDRERGARLAVEAAGLSMSALFAERELLA